MSNPRVLIVDDDSVLRKFVGANLAARNHEVVFAENGAQAIDIIRGERLDLIVLDIMMPHSDGYEVCRQVREHSSVPIIMLSAKDGQSDKLSCLELGADDFLTKPFSLTELLCRIKALLRRSQNFSRTAHESRYISGDFEID